MLPSPSFLICNSEVVNILGGILGKNSQRSRRLACTYFLGVKVKFQDLGNG
jgi:NAD-dependent oxidoreductase involved in siderophore biosynthesis